MKAVVQEGPGAELRLKEVPLPEPGRGEVVVKMKFSPINPSDLSFLQGTYADRPDYPVIPGIEGSGIVVKCGQGLIAKSREGKRVACTSAGKGGTWAEYMVTPALKTIPLGKNIDDDQGSMLLVNPLTAVAFTEIAQELGQGAIVNNAAASALGKMLVSLCRKNGIRLINIVEREDQYEQMKEIGADNVIVSSLPSYEDQLAKLTGEMKARLFFDAVGGEQSELLIKLSPPGSTIVSYAKLSEKEMKVDPRIILQQDKIIRGFYLGNYLSGKTMLQSLRLLRKAKDLLSKEITIKVAARYPLQRINEALESYRAKMSSGKVLLYP